MLGTSAVTREIISRAGKASENFVFPQVFFDCASDDPKICSFVDEYRERYGEDPDTFAAHAYDALGALAAAIDETPVVTADSLRGELNRLTYTGVTGRIAFDTQGDVSRPPRVFAIMGGEIVPFEKFKETKNSQSIFQK